MTKEEIIQELGKNSQKYGMRDTSKEQYERIRDALLKMLKEIENEQQK